MIPFDISNKAHKYYMKKTQETHEKPMDAMTY